MKVIPGLKFTDEIQSPEFLSQRSHLISIGSCRGYLALSVSFSHKSLLQLSDGSSALRQTSPAMGTLPI